MSDRPDVNNMSVLSGPVLEGVQQGWAARLNGENVFSNFLWLINHVFIGFEHDTEELSFSVLYTA